MSVFIRTGGALMRDHTGDDYLPGNQFLCGHLLFHFFQMIAAGEPLHAFSKSLGASLICIPLTPALM